MGVPKFYRWLSERYPCLSEVINDSQIPEFDNLYLDMNGIIHNCSHPNDDDITFRISEEQIFHDIFKYIENLYRMIKPQKVFFMAVDGVAPRAKMNQQRARRFMSAKNADILVKKAREAGADIPDDKRFDSNCITPGTQFMTELHRRLGNWVEEKVNNDPNWRGPRIYLSGHDCPGEGEHKIMDFIRAERVQEGYDPNTRHCMYGLDADLIMLGICSHEPHFSLLREEVKFNRPVRPNQKGNKKPPPRKTDTDTITFHLLHLSLLREYLAWEFINVKDQLSFDYDMEKIIDDWVLMGFLIGNDFIPHLPHVHIHDDALPLLYRTYMQVLPTLDGYINENGYLNLKRFQVFLKTFSKNDRNSFLQSMEDEEYLTSKMGKRQNREGTTSQNTVDELVPFEDEDATQSDGSELEGTPEGIEGNIMRVKGSESDDDEAFQSSDDDEMVERKRGKRGEKSHGVLADGGIQSAADALMALNDDPIEDEFSEQLALLGFKEMDDKEFENNVDNCWNNVINNDFKRHKKRYYGEKLRMGNISKGELREQAEGYVRAIQWNLHYYYHGCCSWNWYFRHHYSPFISDVINFEDMQMGFELSTPFHPFEQLLAVLPAASSECLPKPLRDLMCNAESPIADFYPTDFRTDLNGKKNDWEAVVLIPFIDEKRLLDAILSKETLLSKEDKRRNEHGNHLLFTTINTREEEKWCKREEVEKDTFRIPKEQVVHGLLPNVKLDVYFPGFPTMKHLPHKGSLRELHVKVFNMPTRRPSMQLSILERAEMKEELLTVSSNLIGQEVCVEWPILKLAIVEEVWSEEAIYRREEGSDEVTVSMLSNVEKGLFCGWRRDCRDRLLERFAIDAGEIKVMARVRRLLGTSRVVKDAHVVPVRQWSPVESAQSVPLQMVCTGILVNENVSFGSISIVDAFPVGSKVFVMEPKWGGFGYSCLVKEVDNESAPHCRVVVQVAIPTEPDLRPLRSEPYKFSLPWFDASATSRQCQMDRNLLARLTGTVFLIDCKSEEVDADSSLRPPRVNIGLNLKLSKKNEETPDFARRRGENGYWEYSLLTVRILTEYKNKFRDLITYLERNHAMEDVYYSGDIWTEENIREKRMEELSEWLNGLECNSIEKQKGGEGYVDRQAISHLETILSRTPTQMRFQKSVVQPCKLLRPALQSGGNTRPDSDATFWLLDRVTYALDSSIVPFGLTGTVIGLRGNDYVDVLFDREFAGGVHMRSKMKSCARIPLHCLVNITFAKERKIDKTEVKAAKLKVVEAPPKKKAWEGGSKEKKESREEKSAKSSGSGVAKLLRDMDTARNLPGTSVNDNRKMAKEEKKIEARNLLNMLTGGGNKKGNEGKFTFNKPKDGKEKTNIEGATAGAALLASLRKNEEKGEDEEKKMNRRERRKAERDTRNVGVEDIKEEEEVRPQTPPVNSHVLMLFGQYSEEKKEENVMNEEPIKEEDEVKEELKEEVQLKDEVKEEVQLKEDQTVHNESPATSRGGQFSFNSNSGQKTFVRGGRGVMTPRGRYKNAHSSSVPHCTYDEVRKQYGRPALPTMTMQRQEPTHSISSYERPPRGNTNGNNRGGQFRFNNSRQMNPDEYVKDKVTDLKPSSVVRPRKKQGQRGGRGGIVHGEDKMNTQITTNETTCSSSQQNVPSSAPIARKPRIAAKLGSREQ